MKEVFKDKDTDNETLHEQKLLAAVKDLLATNQGRHFLRWLVIATDTCNAALMEGYAKTAFREGQRAIGCAVLSLVVKLGGAQVILDKEEN